MPDPTDPPSPSPSQHFTYRDHATLILILCGIPFAILTLLSFLFIGFASSSERSQIYLQTAIGIIYFIGSLICFRKCHHLPSLLAYGIMLNLAATYIWLPGLQYPAENGLLFVLPGLALTLTWAYLIYRCYQNRI